MNAGVQGLDVSVRSRDPDWSLESVSGTSSMRCVLQFGFDCEGLLITGTKYTEAVQEMIGISSNHM